MPLIAIIIPNWDCPIPIANLNWPQYDPIGMAPRGTIPASFLAIAELLSFGMLPD